MTQLAWGATPGENRAQATVEKPASTVTCSLQVFRAQDAPYKPGQQMQNKVSGANKVLFKSLLVSQLGN